MEIKSKILIIEDEKSISYFIKTIAEANGFDTITAATGRDAEELIYSHCPDLVLLDLGLPDMDGMELLKGLRKWSALPVIVVSARTDESDKVAALECGADDYIPKPFGTSELIARIKVALRHSNSSNAEIAKTNRIEVGGLVIDYDKFRAYIDGRDAELTQSEFKLVALLGKYIGRVLTYDFLIKKLWGPNARSDNQILRVNMANIRRKIQKDPANPKYLITEPRVGYRLAEFETYSMISN